MVIVVFISAEKYKAYKGGCIRKNVHLAGKLPSKLQCASLCARTGIECKGFTFTEELCSLIISTEYSSTKSDGFYAKSE